MSIAFMKSIAAKRYGVYKIIAVILLLYLLGNNVMFAEEEEKSIYPDIITKQSVEVLPGQVVGRLLLANGDAVIAGKVTKGIVIVHGNLVALSSANIEGIALVIGGQAVLQKGAYTSNVVLAIAPHILPGIGIVFWSILFLGIIFLFLLALAARFLWKRFRNSPFYTWAIMSLKRWPVLYSLAALFCIGITLVLFADLAWHTLFKHTMDFFDNVIIFAVRYFANPGLDQVMIIISSFGYGLYYSGLAAIIFLLFALYRKWTEVLALTICFGGGGVLDLLLKHVFERARPDMAPVVYETGYSFPSGHAMVSLCYYGMLAFLFSREINSWIWRLVVLLFMFLLIIAVGVSRIYLGVHYPTDVLAGYMAGATWLIFCICLYVWRKRNTCCAGETD